jgi:peptidoglycan L-alanyl-D-glutamate endopeptidase CwlK
MSFNDRQKIVLPDGRNLRDITRDPRDPKFADLNTMFRPSPTGPEPERTLRDQVMGGISEAQDLARERTSEEMPAKERFEAALARVRERMAAAGYPITRTSSSRTAEEQNKLYKQGRGSPGKIVTDADGFIKRSRHQDGEGADFAFVVNGKPSWGESHPWQLFGKIAKEEGLEWGGDWKATKPGELGADRPHVQLPSRPLGRQAGATAPAATPAAGRPPVTADSEQASRRFIVDLLPESVQRFLGPQPGVPERNAARSRIEAAKLPRTTNMGQSFENEMERLGTPQAGVARLAAGQMAPPPGARGSMQTGAPGDVLEVDAPKWDLRPESKPAVDLPMTEAGTPFEFTDQTVQPFGFGPQLRPASMGSYPGNTPAPPPPRSRVAGMDQLRPPSGDRQDPLDSIRAMLANRDKPAPEPVDTRPTWKKIMMGVVNGLPDAIVSFTSAWADKPEIADNWLKKQALKIEDANERAKLAALNSKDDFDRMMKILDHEETRAGHRLTISNRAGDLHARVAEGKLKDLTSYFAELNLLSHLYDKFGGNWEDLVSAYPPPFIDQIDQLRDEFNAFWKDEPNEKLLDGLRFRHPLTQKPISGWDAIDILGMFDPDTGNPLLTVGPVTGVDTREGGRNVRKYVPNAKLAGTTFESPKNYQGFQNVTAGGVAINRVFDPDSGTWSDKPTLTPGGGENKSLPMLILRLNQAGIETRNGEAAIAVIRARANDPDFVPDSAFVQQLLDSKDPTDVADLNAMRSAFKSVQEAGRPPAPKLPDPYKWLKDLGSGTVKR